MNFFRKKIPIPSGEKVELEGAELWEVRWHALDGRSQFGNLTMVDAIPHVEVFFSEEDAKLYAQSLTEALLLLRHAGPHTKIKVTKQTQPVSVTP